MTEASNTEFTTEELLSRAKGNATAFVLTTIAYLKERNLDVDDFVAYFGRQFAPGWGRSSSPAGRSRRADGGPERGLGRRHVGLARRR